MLATVVAGGVFAFALWRFWVPRYRPELDNSESYGIDVSSHQGQIDWMQVAGDGIEFAYVKATEGGDFIDPTFSQNSDQAGQAGLEVGAYHYFTLCRDGSEQAANFVDTVASFDADLPPALDLEFAGNCSERPSKEWVREHVRMWIDEVEETTGSGVLLYVSSRFDDRYGILEEFPQATWHRSILRRPDDGRWQIWQASFSAQVDGIVGGVDLNVRRPENR